MLPPDARPIAVLRLLVLLSALVLSSVSKAQTDSASNGSDNQVQVGVNPHTIKVPLVDGNNIRFTRLSTENGLSQTKVSQIVQDDQGFMWFGTQYGLSRYDGYNFKVFVHDPGNPNSLSEVYINALFKDRDGALWVGCDQLLNKLEPSTEIFTKYPIASVTHISQDTTGMLWLATRGSGLYSLDPKSGRTRQYLHNPQEASSLSSNDLISSGQDRTGRFWVSSAKGLDEFDRERGVVTLHIGVQGNPGSSPAVSFYEDHRGVFWIRNLYHDMLTVLDRKTNRLTHYGFDVRKSSSRVVPYITSMAEDHEGNLWLATLGSGLLKFDRDHQRFIRFHNEIGDPESLPQNNVETLFPDEEGNMWGSLGRMGLIHFGTKPLPFKRLPPDPDNPNRKVERFVGALYADRHGILWVGTPDALNRIHREAGRYTSYHRTDWPAANIDVIAIGEDSFGNVWIGTYGHGLLRLDRSSGRFKVYRHDPADPYSLSNDIVTRLLIDHNGTFWVATADGLNRFDAATKHFTVYKFDPQRRSQSYLAMAEDREGTLWLGTDSSGLHRFAPATGRFTVYEHDMNRQDSLSNNRVNSVFFDRSGAMWVGTQDGLERFDPKTGAFTVYLREAGLPGNAIGCILEDGHGNLWTSTNNGVTKFNPQTHSFKNYSTVDGLPGPDLTGWGACSESATGEMFFGGFSGATAFFPENVTESSYVPPVALTDFRLFGTPVILQSGSPLRKPINYTDTITLSHSQNIFSIGFSALSYLNAPTNRYRYMLEGLERRWNEVGSDQRVATYTTLAAGNYTFRVEGATNRSRWDEPGAILHVRILPAWWNTSWFRVISVALGLALLWSILQLRIREARRQERKLRDVIETMPTFAWTALPDGSIDFVNRHFQEFTCLSTAQIAGSGWKAAVHPEDLERNVEKWCASMASGEPFESELRYLRAADGQYRWFLSRAVPLRDARDKIVKWYGTSTDIEDRKRSEQLQTELAHINRVTTMGELTASLAHEIKQPIAATVMNAQTSLRWLKQEQPDLDEASNAIKRIVEDGKRAGEIIERIRSLYTKSQPQRELVDVNEIIREMVVMLRSEAYRHPILVRTQLGGNLPCITADRVQLQQVLMNLMLNAIEAMKDTSGVLTVKSELGQDGRILISVCDTGVGLPAEKTNHIFDAFFTTKPQGSGMGLAISRSIVESHGGHVWATANDGRGATFYFTLPTASDKVNVPATET